MSPWPPLDDLLGTPRERIVQFICEGREAIAWLTDALLLSSDAARKRVLRAQLANARKFLGRCRRALVEQERQRAA